MKCNAIRKNIKTTKIFSTLALHYAIETHQNREKVLKTRSTKGNSQQSQIQEGKRELTTDLKMAITNVQESKEKYKMLQKFEKHQMECLG